MNKNINEINTNSIDDEEVSPASRPPPITFLDFKFVKPTNNGLTLSDDCLTGFNHGIGWRTLIGDTTISLNTSQKYCFDIRINTIDSSWGNSIGVAEEGFVNGSGYILGYHYSNSVSSWAWFTYKGASNDGFIHMNKNVGEKPKSFIAGDIIRIEVDTGDKSISFYNNDEFIGKPFVNIETSKDLVFAITLCGPEDSITIVK